MAKQKREIKSALHQEDVKKLNLENAQESKNGYYQGMSEDGPEDEKLVAPAWVLNKVNHPITLSYGGNALVLPPNGREKVANAGLLGAIPAMVTIVPIKK
jgi:hypothetical protein